MSSKAELALAQEIKAVKGDLIREDGRVERVCEHGVGHTVGHVDKVQLTEDWIWVHGCCGKHCCKTYKLMER